MRSSRSLPGNTDQIAAIPDLPGERAGTSQNDPAGKSRDRHAEKRWHGTAFTTAGLGVYPQKLILVASSGRMLGIFMFCETLAGKEQPPGRTGMRLAYNITLLLKEWNKKGSSMFRRSMRRTLRLNEVGRLPPALLFANQVMASARPAEAVLIFEQFANGALACNGPRAACFFFQAAQAHLLAGRAPEAPAHFRQGLALLSGRAQSGRMYAAGSRSVDELTARSRPAEVEQVRRLLKPDPTGGRAPESGAKGPARVLPATSPCCEARLHSRAVEWVDGLIAERPYCGSAVRVPA